ncbi:ABC transporter substrate-binding protein [Pelosinus baikalensis]|uniref:ABC transporter substrate-binding protein n=1 Tax=Pelosinus baikalensis TaxID=2892015 RepID=A0ABS8HQD5_9FIRM|nr:ABC transporter substrate-binding protein [Pelosinus baikalensis]MCC5464861.1 ABC transporter substrate-binding protein [Pelosinus baikalensis]
MYTIGILQLTQNLDDAVHGFKAELTERGIHAEFHYLNADGNIDQLAKLANQLAEKEVDLIFACSTPAAAAAVKLTQDIPVVFTPVFDPIGANLVLSMVEPGGKATGVAGMVKAEDKLNFINRILPTIQKIGMLYHTEDSNTIVEVANFRKLNNPKVQFIEIPIKEAEDLSNLPDILPNDLDALFLPIGKVIEDNFATIAYYTDTLEIPIIASHAPNIPDGALAGLVANHYQLGKECAVKAKQILKGANPSQIPVDTVKAPEIWLNQFTAENLGISFSEDLKEEATEVFE